VDVSGDLRDQVRQGFPLYRLSCHCETGVGVQEEFPGKILLLTSQQTEMTSLRTPAGYKKKYYNGK
jgi:hypothetical protein